MKPLLPVRSRAYAAVVPAMIFFALSFVWFSAGASVGIDACLVEIANLVLFSGLFMHVSL